MRAISQITISVLFVWLAIISCSDNPLAFKSDEIDVLVSKNKMTIINKTENPIFYFVVERETAAAINWVPISSSENEIIPQQNKQLNLNDVFGFKAGRQIIVYYWSDPNPQSIKNIVVNTK